MYSGYYSMKRICCKCNKREPVKGGKSYAAAGKFVCRNCRVDKEITREAQPTPAAV